MNVHCIKCGESGHVTVDVEDGNTLSCSNCDESYTSGNVRGLMAEWALVLKWLELHPAASGDPAAVAGRVGQAGA